MREIIIGLGFGDEGKGLVTDWRAGQDSTKIVERYTGGHQAGHRVVRNGISHVFSNFASGTLNGNPTFWNAKTFDPVGFINELKILHSKGVKPCIRINPLCPLTTPVEKHRNVNNSENKKHGTVGVGFGETIKRELANGHLYFMDLYYPDILQDKLTCLYGSLDPILWSDFFDSVGQIRERNDLLAKSNQSSEILESSQGLMLDMDYGIFPHITYSRVGTQELTIEDDDEFFLVTRAYQTRHGNGPCSQRIFKPHNPNEENSDDSYQGFFKTRILDFDTLHYALNIDASIRQSHNKNLVVTCMDQVGDKIEMISKRELLCLSQGDFFDYLRENIKGIKHLYGSYGERAENIKRID